jgi:hypothetical protein
MKEIKTTTIYVVKETLRKNESERSIERLGDKPSRATKTYIRDYLIFEEV